MTENWPAMNPHIQTKGALAHSPTARVSNWYPKVQENFKASWRVQPQSPDNLPAAYSPLSKILPIYQHGKVTPLKLEKKLFPARSVGWSDSPHTHTTGTTKDRNEESAVHSTRDTSTEIPGSPETTSQDLSTPFPEISWEITYISLGLIVP